MCFTVHFGEIIAPPNSEDLKSLSTYVSTASAQSVTRWQTSHADPLLCCSAPETGPHCVALNSQQSPISASWALGLSRCATTPGIMKLIFIRSFLSVIGLLIQGYEDPSLGIQSLHWAAFLFPKLLIKLASPSSELVGKCYLHVTCTFSPGMQMSAYGMAVFYSLPRRSEFFSPRWIPQCTTITEGLS